MSAIVLLLAEVFTGIRPPWFIAMAIAMCAVIAIGGMIISRPRGD